MCISLGVSVALIAAVTGIIRLREKAVLKDIDKVQVKIDECDKIIAENQKLHDYLTVLNEYQTEIDTAKTNLDTLPLIKQEVFDKIEENCKNTDSKDDITYNAFSYSGGSGKITITNITLPEQQTANDFIGTFIAQDYFANAEYSGYTGTGKDGNNVVISSVTLSMKDVPDETESGENTEEVTE